MTQRPQENPGYAGPDSGCWAHSLCLTCPHPVCVMEDERFAAHLRGRQARERAIEAARLRDQEGLLPHVIARRLEVSQRTAFRLVVRGRELHSGEDPNQERREARSRDVARLMAREGLGHAAIAGLLGRTPAEVAEILRREGDA